VKPLIANSNLDKSNLDKSNKKPRHLCILLAPTVTLCLLALESNFPDASMMMMNIGTFKINWGTAEAAEQSDLTRAAALFNSKNYAQALPIFNAAFTKDPKNSIACLYAAHSCYYLRDFAGAQRLYTYITKNFVGTDEAAHAAIMLNKLSNASMTQAIGALAKNAQLAAGHSGGGQAVGAGAAESKTKTGPIDLTRNVHVVEPLADHPYASEMLVGNVKNWVQSLPKPVAELLAENNVQFYVTPTLVDLHPEMANTEGAGYDGATLKQCPGMYEPNQRRVIICERTIRDSDNGVTSPRRSDDINDTFFHELGHAIDFCLGEVSVTQEFQHVYRFDEANLRRGDASAERSMAYFLQKAERGQTEACGELIGVLLGIKRNASETTAAFPNTLDFLRKKLKLQ
jgi:tetratricopeptide (TPR) repeat protein